MSEKILELVEPAQERITPKDGSPGHLVRGIFTHVVGEQEVDQIMHRHVSLLLQDPLQRLQ